MVSQIDVDFFLRIGVINFEYVGEEDGYLTLSLS